MKKELQIFDKPQNIRRLLVIFYISLALLVILDFFIDRHAEFAWEGSNAFYAAYGFISCVSLIYIAKLLRFFVIRDENYYRKK